MPAEGSGAPGNQTSQRGATFGFAEDMFQVQLANNLPAMLDFIESLERILQIVL